VVVGIPNPEAGEIPIVIVSLSKAKMIKGIIDEFGPPYAPYAVYTLDDINLDKLPRTESGKVKKSTLQKIILSRRNTSKAISLEHTDNTFNCLISLWKQIGFSPELDTPIKHFADSITIIRFCNKVKRVMQIALAFEDFKPETTMKDIKTLVYHYLTSNRQEGGYLKFAPDDTSFNEFSVSGSPFTSIVPEKLKNDMDVSIKTKLNSQGFSYPHDVSAIYPIKPSYHIFLAGRRPQSYRHRVRVEIRLNQDRIVQAIRSLVLRHDILRTVAVRIGPDTFVHIVMRPSERLMSKIVHYISTKPDTKNFSNFYMFEAAIHADVNPTNAYFTYNHSIMDTVCAMQWYSHLDILLENPEAVDNNLVTPYHLFSEHLFFHSNTARSSSIDWHVNRFRGISSKKYLAWPPQRAPHWMVNDDTGSADWDMRESSRVLRAPKSLPRIMKQVEAPFINTLRARDKIEPFVIALTAVATFNTCITGSDTALLNIICSGRYWPFTSSGIARKLPPASSIDGPTIDFALGIITLDDDEETIFDLLKRISNYIAELNHHIHVPMTDVFRELTEEDADAVRKAMDRQTFNWDISLPCWLGMFEDYKSISLKERWDFPDT
jgi:hypothetical protein